MEKTIDKNNGLESDGEKKENLRGQNKTVVMGDGGGFRVGGIRREMWLDFIATVRAKTGFTVEAMAAVRAKFHNSQCFSSTSIKTPGITLMKSRVQILKAMETGSCSFMDLK